VFGVGFSAAFVSSRTFPHGFVRSLG